MSDIDAIVIGGGIIGLSVAYALSGNMNVFVIEKEEHYGRGISSRNSEVIHAGIYYPPNSLKAKLCVQGRDLLYQFLKNNNLPYKQLGKYIVSLDEEGDNELLKLKNNAENCGVKNLKIINGKHLESMGIKCQNALFSPLTGVFSVHDFMNKLAYYIKNNGSDIILGSEIINIEKNNNKYIVFIKEYSGEITEIKTQIVINAAGLNSTNIAKFSNKNYSLYLCKGDYFSVFSQKPQKLNSLIYPLPEKNGTGLGIHLTIDTGGRMKLGPDTKYIDMENYSIDNNKKEIFYKSITKFLPWININDIYPDMSGIRPKLQGPDDDFKDYIIENIDNFINLVGIESPGLTAALAIGEKINSFFVKS